MLNLLVEDSTLADDYSEMHDWGSEPFRPLSWMVVFLLIMGIIFLGSGCEMLGTAAATASEKTECTRVKNLINPDSTEYIVFSETGSSLNTDKAGFKDDNQHTLRVNENRRAVSHLLIWVEGSDGTVYAEEKQRLNFSGYQNRIGCHLLAVSNPNDINFEFE